MKRTTFVKSVTLIFVAALVGSCSTSHAEFEEPGIRGKIVDADTQQPLPGVVVFGYYATVEGSLGGGESLQDVVRVFEVESDANGVFEIPPWSSGTQKIKGEARNQFPAMGFFKGGYKTMNKRLGSLRQWSPFNLKGTATYTLDGRVYDWTAQPHEMRAATTEKERYTALIDARDSTGYKGPCGWEQHAMLLMAQHVEWMSWYQRNIPVKDLDAKGYPKGTMTVPPELQRYSFVFETGVDSLINTFDKSPEQWKCANPRIAFRRGMQ